MKTTEPFIEFAEFTIFSKTAGALHRISQQVEALRGYLSNASEIIGDENDTLRSGLAEFEEQLAKDQEKFKRLAHDSLMRSMAQERQRIRAEVEAEERSDEWRKLPGSYRDEEE